MMKEVLKRGLILALIFIGIACVGGIAFLDLPVILIVVLVVIALGITTYLIKRDRSERNDN